MLEETLNDLSLLKVLQYLCHRQKEIISMQPKSRGGGGRMDFTGVLEGY